MNSPAAMAELAMISAAPRGAVAEPGPGEVLVVAIAAHKVGPPPKGGREDTRTKYWPGQQYVCARADAEYAQGRDIVHILSGMTYDWWGTPGRVLSPWGEGAPLVTQETPGALRIAQGTGFDPGAAAYRFHSAMNAASKHASAFVRWGDTSPYTPLRQLDGERDAALARNAVLTADVLHNHMGYFLLNNTGLQRRDEQVLVLHYHGSRPDGKPLCGDRMPGAGGMSFLQWDQARGAKIVCARLSLVEEVRSVAVAKGLGIVPEWLPIPMDVERYRALVTTPAWDGTGTFRIAHSPTNRRFKGSDSFLTNDRERGAIATLRRKGLKVEAVLIEGLPHGEALALKATCHAAFDSFWLGMQGSGLEAAAMGIPVIAGDPMARDAHVAFAGYCPYTYANDERALGAQIERLVLDADYYAAEAARVAQFVQAHHSYPAVARRYEHLLALWTGRDDVFTESDRSPTQVRSESQKLPRKRRKVA